jgi:hypothetical protein
MRKIEFLIGEEEEKKEKEKIYKEFLNQIGVKDNAKDEFMEFLELKAYEKVKEIWESQDIWRKILNKAEAKYEEIKEGEHIDEEGKIEKDSVEYRIFYWLAKEFRDKLKEEIPKILKEELKYRYTATEVAFAKALIDYYGKNPLELIRERAYNSLAPYYEKNPIEVKEEEKRRDEELIEGKGKPKNEIEEIYAMAFKGLKGISFDVENFGSEDMKLKIGNQKYTVEDPIGRKKIKALIWRKYMELKKELAKYNYGSWKLYREVAKNSEEDPLPLEDYQKKEVIRRVFEEGKVENWEEVISALENGVENREPWDSIQVKLYTLQPLRMQYTDIEDAGYIGISERLAKLQEEVVKCYGTNIDEGREDIAYLKAPNPFFNVIGVLASSRNINTIAFSTIFELTERVLNKIENEIKRNNFEVEYTINEWERNFKEGFSYLKKHLPKLKEVMNPNYYEKLVELEEKVNSKLKFYRKMLEEKRIEQKEQNEVLLKKINSIEKGNALESFIEKTKNFLSGIFKP